MILLENLRNRLGLAGERLKREIQSTVDLEAWQSAMTLHERLGAVSWPRAGIAAGAVGVLAAGLMVVVLYDRPDAYPPPDPTAAELSSRRNALMHVSAPPPSLVEANKSWKAR